MPKFFIDENQINGDNIVITGEDVKHIKVFRCKLDDIITLCHMERYDYECKIIQIDADKVIARIVNKKEINSEAKTNVTIYQGLAKSDKMEYIIQKAVELGVNRIVPLITKNTVVKIDDIKKEERKLERWNKISEAAAKQAGRGMIPKVDRIMTLDEAIADNKDNDLKILLYENEKKLTIHQIFDISIEYKNISVFIGPEGGLQESEVKKAKENDIKVITLGNRILRTETVSIVILAIIMYNMGEI
ncbi:MAG TPA: 16S rRNA (uracil(1498)-N(3))-methyltransferase [Clostridiales bacterium]|nr:MAG: hypothetical protein A2Y18_07570 [Clostridiales bacterium GWD2_32_19]HCC06859.1 16S rRNA (uracil(1498)-N(3))-methyltransferase [Clostridiales bacterium]